MKQKEAEELILSAIKGGASNYTSIIQRTGLTYNVVSRSLGLLYAEYNVPNLAGLYRLLAPREPVLGHDSTVLDKGLKVELAAMNMVSVLGVEYCERLIVALQAEIKKYD